MNIYKTPFNPRDGLFMLVGAAMTMGLFLLLRNHEPEQAIDRSTVLPELQVATPDFIYPADTVQVYSWIAYYTGGPAYEGLEFSAREVVDSIWIESGGNSRYMRGNLLMPDSPDEADSSFTITFKGNPRSTSGKELLEYSHIEHYRFHNGRWVRSGK